jgi:alpha-L-arabinofuranosidase
MKTLNIKFVPALMILLAASGEAQQPDGPVAVTVTIDTSKPGVEIDRHIYGQFTEHLGRVIYEGIWVGPRSPIPNIRGYRKDVIDALKRIHVPVIRWPGGCFADQYDWRDGIGPRNKRPTRVNPWGGVSENNAFGTHEFLDLAELIGADAYISGNVGSMSPHEMAQWLEYMTSPGKSSLANERRRNGRDKPWQVKYFGIGNEIWGCGGLMRAEAALDVTRRYSQFLNLSPSQEQLLKVASGPSGNVAGYEAFAETMMMNAKDIFGDFDFQALSLHYYTWLMADNQAFAILDNDLASTAAATGFQEDTWSNYLRASLQMETLVARVSKIMDVYDPDKKISLYVDEWGTVHQQNPALSQQNTLLDAEVAALTFNTFQRHTDRVKMANVTLMINAGQALILTDKERMLLTPTYHVFDMYQPFRGATPYPVTVSKATYEYGGHSVSAVDVSAAKGTDGQIYLALVNLDPHRAAIVLTNLSGNAHGQILTGPTMDTHNTFEAPETIHPESFSGSSNSSGTLTFKLPAKSVAVVAVER